MTTENPAPAATNPVEGRRVQPDGPLSGEVKRGGDVKHPAKLVEAIYTLADLMLDASRVLEGTYAHRGLWRDLPEQRADELEKLIKGFDFLMTSKAVREYADAWQAELDRAEPA